MPVIHGGTRPGVLTAVGVVSIVVACLSGIACIWMAIMLFAFVMVAKVSGALATMPAPPLPPPTPPPAVVTPANPSTSTSTSDPTLSTLRTHPRGLPPEQRQTVADALGQLQIISPDRLEQLDALTARAGKDIFPQSLKQRTDELQPEDVLEMIQAHTVGLSNDPAVPGPDTFRTERGRIELYDDHAVYYPKGGRAAVRVSTLTDSPSYTPRPSASAASSSTTTNTPPTSSSRNKLSKSQIEMIVQQAQTASGNAMNASQLAALRNLLNTPGQQYVSRVTVSSAIRSASVMPDGSVFINFPGGFAQLGPQGQVTNTMTTGFGPATPFPFGGGGKAVKINGGAMALAAFEVIASFGLAVYLLVSGILVIRNSPRGRKLHLIYAAIKIPITILGGLGVWWLLTGFFSSMTTASGMPNPGAGMSMSVGIQTAVMCTLALIYPVALLIVMQTQAVKDYYRPAGE
jgi:hypothetical protein